MRRPHGVAAALVVGACLLAFSAFAGPPPGRLPSPPPGPPVGPPGPPVGPPGPPLPGSVLPPPQVPGAPAAPASPRPPPEVPGAPGGQAPGAAAGRDLLAREHYTMVDVAPGTFEMGSAAAEPGRFDDEARHTVRLTRGFAIGATEVTVQLWRDVSGQLPPELPQLDANAPVAQVNWFDAVEFCNRLSTLEGRMPAYRLQDHQALAGELLNSVEWDRNADGYRLPTEAEWEYAARAGQATPFAGSARVGDVGWTDVDGAAVARVAARKPNAWGLYDMSGGAWEWTWDHPGAYPSSAVDPVGPADGFFRVLRGGSRAQDARMARVAARGWIPPYSTDPTVGLRVVRPLSSGR